MRWTAVWTRAVVVPAWRRAAAAWAGSGIVAAVVFGPAGMRPSDLTGLALYDPGVGVVLGAIWLLVFLPTARMIVRPAPATYLYSLPGDPRSAQLVGAAALIVLQLPWLALWLLGEGLRGGAIVLATTAVIVALARWRPPAVRPRTRAWRSGGEALRAIYRGALRRRAGDALVRGAGMAVLAGMAAGLPIRNNQLSGETAGVLGAAIIAVVLVPAQIGPALVAIGAHRETAWLVAALGIPRRTQIAALVHAVVLVHLAAAAIAIAAAMIISGPNGWLAILALALALGTSLGEARAMLANEASPTVATRIVAAALVAAALAVACLAVLGPAGAAAVLATGAFSLLTVPP